MVHGQFSGIVANRSTGATAVPRHQGAARMQWQHGFTLRTRGVSAESRGVLSGMLHGGSSGSRGTGFLLRGSPRILRNFSASKTNAGATALDGRDGLARVGHRRRLPPPTTPPARYARPTSGRSHRHPPPTMRHSSGAGDRRHRVYVVSYYRIPKPLTPPAFPPIPRRQITRTPPQCLGQPSR